MKKLSAKIILSLVIAAITLWSAAAGLPMKPVLASAPFLEEAASPSPLEEGEEDPSGPEDGPEEEPDYVILYFDSGAVSNTMAPYGESASFTLPVYLDHGTDRAFSYTVALEFDHALLEAVSVSGEGVPSEEPEVRDGLLLVSGETELYDPQTPLFQVLFAVRAPGQARLCLSLAQSVFALTQAQASLSVTLDESNERRYLEFITVGNHIPVPPAFICNSIEFEVETTVSFAARSDGAAIFYSTAQGAAPPERAYLAGEQIVVSEKLTIRAIAVKNGFSSEEVFLRLTKLPTQRRHTGAVPIPQMPIPTQAPPVGEAAAAGSALPPDPQEAAREAPGYDYTDLQGHWAAEYLLRAVALGIMQGYEDQTLRPDAALTRGEAAKLVALALSDVPAEAVSEPLGFADSLAIPSWSAPFVRRVTLAGIMSGYPDNTFRPEDFLTREELAVIACRGFSMAGNAGAPFSDREKISPWAKKAVCAAVECGVMSGYPDGSFHPGALVTRGEAAKILTECVRLFGRYGMRKS